MNVEKNFAMHMLNTKSSPRTWYRVEEGGMVIEVTENEQDFKYTGNTGTTENEEALKYTEKAGTTPVQDEWPSPTDSPATPSTCNMDDVRTPLQTTESSTMTCTDTTDTGCNPRPSTQLHDQATYTEPPQTMDHACSPIRAKTADMGTDPIPWWLEETRQYLKQESNHIRHPNRSQISECSMQFQDKSDA
jgi:hypothetical protein